jgi:hypothetical protein
MRTQGKAKLFTTIFTFPKKRSRDFQDPEVAQARKHQSFPERQKNTRKSRNVFEDFNLSVHL